MNDAMMDIIDDTTKLLKQTAVDFKKWCDKEGYYYSQEKNKWFNGDSEDLEEDYIFENFLNREKHGN